MKRRRIRGSRQRGALLGVVLLLLVAVFSASVFAMWTVRTDSGSAGRDRLSRQLFDCAEQGLAWGKQYFGVTARLQWNAYLAASNVCSAAVSTTPAIGPVPCAPDGPFPTGGAGTGVVGYPNQAPYTTQIEMSPDIAAPLEYTVAIYNDPADPSPWADTNNRIIIYSRCVDVRSLESRTVQELISVPMPSRNDYYGQAGHGFRNQGNQNY